MERLTDIGVIRRLMNAHGMSFSKALGQNFIIDPSVCPRMAEMSGIDEHTGVLEIGGGVGVLTAELAKRAKRVVCVELDTRLIPLLEESLSDFDNVLLINGDILKVELPRLLPEWFDGCDSICVCANLPYYITSPVLMLLLESRLPLRTVTVMVQKEAADRLCAEVGGKNAGAVTVAVRYYAEARKLFSVSRGSFMPSPNVDSAVIRLDVRRETAMSCEAEKFFFSMIKAAFAQRRKTAVNGISSGMGIDKQTVIEALRETGLPENVRAEGLTMEQLIRLSEVLKRRTKAV